MALFIYMNEYIYIWIPRVYLNMVNQTMSGPKRHKTTITFFQGNQMFQKFHLFNKYM